MSLTIFLAEEASMEEMLRGFLPVLFPNWTEGVDWRCIPHEGKSDLEASIPHKLRGWRQPNVRFVILRDQDSANCVDVKRRLRELCASGGRPNTLIRIPCRELEAWYLGDLAAVDAALGTQNLSTMQDRKKFRNPDRLQNASKELAKIAPYQKRSGSRAIGPQLNPDTNRSHSFRVFVAGLRKMAESGE